MHRNANPKSQETVQIYVGEHTSASIHASLSGTADFLQGITGLHFDIIPVVNPQHPSISRANWVDLAAFPAPSDPPTPFDRLVRLRASAMRTYDVNPFTYAGSAWSWHKALGVLDLHTGKEDLRNPLFVEAMNSFRRRFDKAYVFGTGPSLAQARDYDFSDGFRVVCNTMVKHPELKSDFDPHVIVAGDALYHFSDTAHARQFQEDLDKFLERSSAFFVYPSLFHSFVRRRFASHQSKLVAIPVGRRGSSPTALLRSWELPRRGNVLNLLLLPVAVSVCDEVVLVGFDGRKAGDRGFWANAVEYSYPELVRGLMDSHPAFFRKHVPSEEPGRYARRILGNQVGKDILALRKQGVHLSILGESHSSSLKNLPCASVNK